jgi:hypothetical protein
MLTGLARCGPRAQLIGSMGLGKSGAALLHAVMVEWQTGRWPGLLILAPLQVAFAWQREIPHWLPGKTVALIAGDEAARVHACQSGADIHILTYDNIPWLHERVPGSWRAFGSMVVCDESQRVKNFRGGFRTSTTGKVYLQVSDKCGVQTDALSRHAADFDYWLNATGSMRPNHAIDLWGQYWFLDGGHRLTRSFTQFTEAWFRMPVRGGPFKVPELIPGAQEEIARRVADITVLARTEDYYQVAAPVIIDRVVQLPEKARAAYRAMRTKLAAEVVDEQGNPVRVTALSAGAKVQKLLQIAAGFAYHRDEDADPELRLCTELHRAKIDAVESIIEETGEPLIVVYMYQATLDQLRAKFKKRLRELDTTGRAQDDWNAGRVEILALQYSAGALGLSLQHGGRNMCLLSPTYRADDYAQILERMGPLRQMQSGYNRAVHVFRLHAEATEDSRVFDVSIGKISAEQAYYDVVQGLQRGVK